MPNPPVLRELSIILARAMAKRPEERFQSADAFRQAIENVRAESVEVSPRPALSRPVRLTVAIAVLTIFMTIMVAAIGNRRLPVAQLPTPKSFTVPPPPAITSSPLVSAPPIETAPRVPATRPKQSAMRTRSTPTNERETIPPKQEIVAAPAVPGMEIAETPAAAIDAAATTPDAAGAEKLLPPPSKLPEVKPHNPVVKLVKKLNPFQRGVTPAKDAMTK